MVGYFTEIFLYLVNNIFHNEIFPVQKKHILTQIYRGKRSQ